MPRAEAFKTGPSSPVQKYLSWSSPEKKFYYYDKEKGTNIFVELPMSIIFLDAKATIKGFHAGTQSSIYSNDVANTKNEKFVVRSFKSPIPLAEGFYQEIKAKLGDIGGDYHVSLYAFSDSLGVINIAMKGAALKEWSDFATANRKSFLGSYIEIKGADDRKNGAIKYSVPLFATGGAISMNVSESSDKAYDTLMEYFKSREGATAPAPAVVDAVAEEVAPAPQADEFDGLPF